MPHSLQHKLRGYVGCSYLWVDGDTIAALVVPRGRGAAPQRPLAPSGPRISTNIQGSVSQARTYQDLLKNAYDEELFEHHAFSDLVYVKVGGPGLSPLVVLHRWCHRLGGRVALQALMQHWCGQHANCRPTAVTLQRSAISSVVLKHCARCTNNTISLTQQVI